MDTTEKSYLQNIHFAMLLLGCAVLGIAARAGAVAYLNLWHDEIYSLNLAQSSFAQFREFVSSGADYHPPGFYFSLQLVRLASQGQGEELALRLANLSWYLVLIVGMGIYGWRHIQARRTLVVFSLLIAVSPHFVYLGAELRMYSMLLCLSFVSLMCAHMALSTRRLRWFTLFGLASLLAILTHYASFVLTASIFGALLVCGRAQVEVLRGCALSALIVVLGLVPFVGMLSIHLVKEPAYFVPMWRSLLYVSLAVSLPLLVAGAVFWLWNFRQRASHPRSTKDISLGRFALVAACAFFALLFAIKIVRGVNLLNLGVSLVPACWLVLAISQSLSKMNSRQLSVLLSCVLLGQVALSARLLRDPSTVSGNRMSTLAKYKAFIEEHPQWQGPNRLQRTVVLIDWPRDNEYFRQKTVSVLHPDRVEALSTGRADQAPEAVRRHLGGDSSEVLMLTRGRLTEAMLPDDDLEVQHLGRGVALVTQKREK